MKTALGHQSLETPTETDIQEHVYQKPVRYVDELKWRLIEMWSATSRASLIKGLISGDIILMRVSKPKANTWNDAMTCFSVTVMIFKRTLLRYVRLLCRSKSVRPSVRPSVRSVCLSSACNVVAPYPEG